MNANPSYVTVGDAPRQRGWVSRLFHRRTKAQEVEWMDFMGRPKRTYHDVDLSKRVQVRGGPRLAFRFGAGDNATVVELYEPAVPATHCPNPDHLVEKQIVEKKHGNA